MADDAKQTYTPSGQPVGWKGSRAGETFKSQDQLDDEAAEADYAKQQGATGIAGAAKRARPEYKTGLQAYKSDRKKKKSGLTGADAADALAAAPAKP